LHLDSKVEFVATGMQTGNRTTKLEAPCLVQRLPTHIQEKTTTKRVLAPSTHYFSFADGASGNQNLISTHRYLF
jgi:hypothetical protein